MSVRRIKLRGRWRWQARVAYDRQRRSRVCDSREEARQAEAALLREFMELRAAEEASGAQPATVRGLCALYETDLERRGKSPDSVIRARTTAAAIERVSPWLAAKAVGAVTERRMSLRSGRPGWARERPGRRSPGISRPFEPCCGWPGQSAVTDKSLQAVSEAVNGNAKWQLRRKSLMSA